MQRRTIIAEIALTACASASGGGESTADNQYGLVQPGTLTVCSGIPYLPFEVEDPSAKSG